MMNECARYYRDVVPDGVWRAVYDGLAASGRLADSFPHLKVCRYEMFHSMMTMPDRHVWALTFRGELGGVVYLTDREGSRAYIHFAFLPTQARRSAGKLPVPVALGRFAVASLLRDTWQDGYALDTAIGVTPATHRAAIKMITRCGAQVLGEIPGAVYLAANEANVPGLVTYYTRETTNDEWRGL